MPPDTAPPRNCDILLLEDDPALRRRVAAWLRSQQAQVTEAGSLAEARRLLGGLSFDFALVDLHLPDGEVLELLRERAFSENTGVVVMTAFGGVAKAVEAMRLGAGDYLSKPFEFESLPVAFLRCRQTRAAGRREQHRSGANAGATSGDLFFGKSLESVRTQLDAILGAERRLQGALPPVLIEGETGTGKSALARWLHGQGPRSGKPLVTVNCSALPDTLVESELFGHERGAFTDAKQARTGLFEAADGGTLFLDEIGTLPPATQAKVLLAVEEGRIRRLGANKELQVDVRLIAASNQALSGLVERGAFREDLYHRLDLLRVELPPLRKRGREVLELARHLLARLAVKHRLGACEISPEGAARLLAQAWPGNIRQLAHELERALIFGGGGRLDFAHLGPVPTESAAVEWLNPSWRLPESGFCIEDVVTRLVAEGLRETGGNVSAAARRLGVTREFLRYRLQAGERPEEAPGCQPPKQG